MLAPREPAGLRTFFQPSSKLTEKERDGARVRKMRMAQQHLLVIADKACLASLLAANLTLERFCRTADSLKET